MECQSVTQSVSQSVIQPVNQSVFIRIRRVRGVTWHFSFRGTSSAKWNMGTCTKI